MYKFLSFIPKYAFYTYLKPIYNNEIFAIEANIKGWWYKFS